MSSLVRHVTIDCADAYTLASFWAQILDGSLAEDDFPGDPMALLTCTNGVQLLFITGPDTKTVKNRIHFDLQPQDRTRDEEVTRLLTLGATQVADQRRPDGTGWVVLADIEGNEFCVERSAAERSATERAATESA